MNKQHTNTDDTRNTHTWWWLLAFPLSNAFLSLAFFFALATACLLLFFSLATTSLPSSFPLPRRLLFREEVHPRHDLEQLVSLITWRTIRVVIKVMQHKTQSENHQYTPNTHTNTQASKQTTTYVNMHSMHGRQTNNKQLRHTMSWWKVPPVSSSGGGDKLNEQAS